MKHESGDHKNRSTQTSHDASRFYNSRLYQDLPGGSKVRYVENPVPQQNLDQILAGSSEAMAELPNSCLHLMVTTWSQLSTKQHSISIKLTLQ